jgi:hypothetical protein
MSLLDRQRQVREIGRIRTGTKGEKGFPIALDTFRLTTSSHSIVERAAGLWGGTVQPWDNQYELVTETAELFVEVPWQDPDQMSYYELWSAAGIKKRCNGVTILNTDALPPCNCDPENRECKPHTRLRLFLPDLTGINGSWMLASTGYFAADELAGVIDEMQRRVDTRQRIPYAVLGLEQRETPGKQFVVPTLTFTGAFRDLSDGGGFSSLPSPSDAAGESGSPDSPPGDPPTLPDMPDTIKARLVDAGGPIHVETFPAEPDTGEDSDIASGVDDETVVEFPTPNDEQWALLLDTIAEDPVEGTMDVIEERVRRLYRLMRENGIEHWGGDALHAMLAKHHAVEHVRDLKRAELEKFAKTSWMHAEGAVANG